MFIIIIIIIIIINTLSDFQLFRLLLLYCTIRKRKEGHGGCCFGNDSGRVYVGRYELLFFFLPVRPRVVLHSGPLYAVKGSDVTLPTCQVTGHPQPVVTWSKSFGQLPHGRVQYNNSFIKLLDVRTADSDNYICTARNLLGSAVKRTVLVVVSLPQFTVKPPVEVVAVIGDTLKLNCSATGDPQPVISWKRQGAKLPVGRTQQINGALIITHIEMNDAGNYICVATSGRLFDVETVTYVQVVEGKGGPDFFYCNCLFYPATAVSELAINRAVIEFVG